ncbi:MAG: hypothetical protein AAB692_05355 [Patescibacteria group bacterium]
MPKSLRKYLRRQKAVIRRAAPLAEHEAKITELYASCSLTRK